MSDKEKSEIKEGVSGVQSKSEPKSSSINVVAGLVTIGLKDTAEGK